AINQTIKKTRPVAAQDSTETEDEIVGNLRAVDLDKDFLDVVVNGQGLHIVGLAEAMDDVIGPMINKTVKVQVVRSAKGLRFRDLELDEYPPRRVSCGSAEGRSPSATVHFFARDFLNIS